MSQLHELFDITEITTILQGIKSLQKENEAIRTSCLNRLAPGDTFIPQIIDGLDRRAKQLQELQSKLTALANSS